MRKYIFLVFLLASLGPTSFGQQNPAGKPAKFKPPKVQSFLGGHRNGDSLNSATAKLLLALPLVVIDVAKNNYTVENYRFLYKKKAFNQNPETGKIEESFTLSAGDFTETPLPKVWIENVGLDLLKGEEFYFFEIIVHDKNGHRFLAPDLKLFIL
jgi:hypothetical protein